MNREALQSRVVAVVEGAIRDQVSLKRLSLERIEPTASLIGDLGIDSVDLLTVVYDIEVALGTQLPIREWLENAGDADGRAAFTVGDLVSHIVGVLNQTPAEAA